MMHREIMDAVRINGTARVSILCRNSSALWMLEQVVHMVTTGLQTLNLRSVRQKIQIKIWKIHFVTGL